MSLQGFGFIAQSDVVRYLNDEAARLAVTNPEKDVIYTVLDSLGDGSNIRKSWTYDNLTSTWIEVETETPAGTITFSVGPATFPTTPSDNDTHMVTDNGLPSGLVQEFWKYDKETLTWVSLPLGNTCPAPMTRAALIALRASAGLDTNCHYVITNPNAQGTLTAQKIILHAVDESTLSMQAGIFTSHDVLAWNGTYDIDADDVLEITDNLQNHVISNASIVNFPFGVAAVNGNIVNARSNLIHTGGNFANNTIASDATVTNAGNTARNHFEANSNTTISSGDFRENRVEGDATVNSSTTGDVDNNIFGVNSNSTISGASNMDNSEVATNANLFLTGGAIINTTIKEQSTLRVSGGVLRESTVGQEASVTLISGDNYENTWGNSVVYNQVGSGYIRYSTIEGTTTWTNGDTNISNVTAYTATVNTTGSVGTIANSTLNRAYCAAMLNIPSLTIQNSTISNYGQVSATNAARLYFYSSTFTDGSRILVSAGSRVDASYTNVRSYGYLQSSVSGGFLQCNYCEVGSYGYIRNTTPNTNRAERCDVSSQSNIRFDGSANNCRVYYCNVSGGAAIYHTGTSNGCYIYYATANSLAQIYTQNSTNARMYYIDADSYSYIRSINNSATHYIYYCSANARGYIQMQNNTGLVRFYGVSARGQSIVEIRNSSLGNIYYSTFDAYFYLYATLTAGTRSGLFGQGRLTRTRTNPATGAPIIAGAYITNIQ